MTNDTTNLKGYEWGVPKAAPGVQENIIMDAIANDPVYSEALAQYKSQIAYGVKKYPETLGHAGWDILEALNHEIGELVDTLNYKVLLKQKLEKAQANGYDLKKIFG